MTVLKVLFWICLAICIYTNVGYGIILYLMVCIKRMIKGRTKRRELPEDDALPDVTFLVCAYNEQDIVDVKMENIQPISEKLIQKMI